MKFIPFGTAVTTHISRLVLPLLIALTVILTVGSAAAAPEQPLSILSVTPTGEDVPASQQLVIKFSRPVVPVGRMERSAAELPISITPSLDCEWRWLNTTSLACQLKADRPMLPATSYKLTIQPGIKAEDGVTIAEPFEHSFVTARPAVSDYWFRNWRSPGTPLILVSMNQPVTKESLEAHMFFALDDGAKRVPVIASEIPPGSQEKRLVNPTSDVQVDVVVTEQQPADPRKWYIQPKTELPLDAKVDLTVEPGVKSVSGNELGIEERVFVEFYTFPEFRFLGVRCRANDDTELMFTPGSPAPEKSCNPLGRSTLVFSAPVMKEEVKAGLKVTPDLAGGRTDFDPWESVYTYSHLEESHESAEDYEVGLPYYLKAAQAYQLQAAAGSIKDEFGRTLAADVSAEFRTDHREPKFVNANRYSVLEKAVDSHLPLFVTNLTQVGMSFEMLTAAGVQSDQSHTIDLPKVEDIAFAIPIKVREILGGKSGVITGEYSTTPHTTVPEYSSSAKFFSQVTPFSVHAKLGHFNSLVWVTSLESGLPVSGATVQIIVGKLNRFAAHPEILSRGITDKDGAALLDGTERIDPSLTMLESWNDAEDKLFVKVIKGDDIALLPITYDFSIYPSTSGDGYIDQFMRSKLGHLKAWGSTAQGVYKVGDKVEFKLYIRNHNNDQFVPAPRDGYSLEVIDPMDKVVHTVSAFTLNEFGGYSGEFLVPSNGTVGQYRFVVKSEDSEYKLQPMTVLISDFTPAPFRVQSEVTAQSFTVADTVHASAAARLHAGGPYGKAPVRINSLIRERSIAPSDPKAEGFNFSSTASYDPQTIFSLEETLDDQGNFATEFKIPETPIQYGTLEVESAVKDDRGKSVANQTSAKFFSRDRFLGLKLDGWVLDAGKPASIRTIVIDQEGKIATGAPLKVTIKRQQVVASRVKGAGNAYLTNYETKIIDVSECLLVSAAEPLPCTFTPPEPGIYDITGTVTDTKGREQTNKLSQWVVGKGDYIWQSEPGFELQVMPEKRGYKVGDTARFLVQNPYPGAKALITLERYGTMKRWTQTLSGSSEIVEFPVTADHVPGFYLSVVVMSPRVDKPVDENQVDLGKPAFRMGYAQIEVKDPYKEIVLEVKPQAEVYKPRERVVVDISAKTRQGKTPKMEFAVAVLDESVFDLIQGGRKYYDPYKGFYELEGLDLKNFNLLKELVGRRKFEVKGGTPGGGGGLDSEARTMFKFVSYWNPSLKADAQGQAKIEFEVPDNLTGWRVLVMAVTPEDRMGLGEGTFKVNKETEIRPALPNQVTEGDSFEAAFTVMNRTDKPRTLDVKLAAEGRVKPDGADAAVVRSSQILAKPYERVKVTLPVTSSADGEIAFTVSARDGIDSDTLKLSLPVKKRSALEAAATYGSTDGNAAKDSVLFPKEIRTDVGRLSVVVSSTVIAGLEGAFEYMKLYPYLCWEQILSKGVMASHYNNLKRYLSKSFSWNDTAKMPETTLSLAASFQAPNGGMTFFVPKDEYVSPYLSAYTAIAFNWLIESGYKVPEPVETALHGYLLEMVRKDVMPDFYSKGMASSTRAVALAALAERNKLTRDEVTRHFSHLKEMDLFGAAHFMFALIKVGKTDEMQQKVVAHILAHANETGGKFIFQEDLDYAWTRIMTSTLRTNCAVLSALVAFEAAHPNGTALGDVPFKLVRALTQTRKQKGHWENTQENMFCMEALADYARHYEKSEPDFKVEAYLGDDRLGEKQYKGFEEQVTEFSKPITAADPGRKTEVRLEKTGTGRFYYSTRLEYSPLTPRAESVNSGIEVRREYSVERNGKWELLKPPMTVGSGELVRVDLFVTLPAQRNFVVVNDPIPGGLEPVNRDLATASTVDADKADTPGASGGKPLYAQGSIWWDLRDWRDFNVSFWSFYHKELRHDSARFYSEYLPQGNYHLSYVAQAIAPGSFVVMPTHAEEMYDPDVFGQSGASQLSVAVQSPVGQSSGVAAHMTQ